MSSSSSSLSKEQLAFIEKNRQQALLIKKNKQQQRREQRRNKTEEPHAKKSCTAMTIPAVKFYASGNGSGSSSNSNSSSRGGGSYKPELKPYTNLPVEPSGTTRFTVRMPTYNSKLVDLFKKVSSSAFDAGAKSWTFSNAHYHQLG